MRSAVLLCLVITYTLSSKVATDENESEDEGQDTDVSKGTAEESAGEGSEETSVEDPGDNVSNEATDVEHSTVDALLKSISVGNEDEESKFNAVAEGQGFDVPIEGGKLRFRKKSKKTTLLKRRQSTTKWYRGKPKKSKVSKVGKKRNTLQRGPTTKKFKKASLKTQREKTSKRTTVKGSGRKKQKVRKSGKTKKSHHIVHTTRKRSNLTAGKATKRPSRVQKATKRPNVAHLRTQKHFMKHTKDPKKGKKVSKGIAHTRTEAKQLPKPGAKIFASPWRQKRKKSLKRSNNSNIARRASVKKQLKSEDNKGHNFTTSTY